MTTVEDRRSPEPDRSSLWRIGAVAPPLAGERRLTTAAWSVPHALEFVAGIAVGQALLVLLAGWGRPRLEAFFTDLGASPMVSRLVLVAFVVAALAVPYGLMWWLIVRSARIRGLELRQLTGMRRPPLAKTAMLVVVYTFVALAAVTLWGTLLVVLGVQTPNPTFEIARALRRDPLTLALLALLTVTLAPFVEELVFRGVVLPSLRTHFGDGWAVIGSALLFAVIHFQLAATPSFFAVGVVLGLIYLQTRSLWAAVALHATYNAVVAVIVFTALPMAAR